MLESSEARGRGARWQSTRCYRAGAERYCESPSFMAHGTFRYLPTRSAIFRMRERNPVTAPPALRNSSQVVPVKRSIQKVMRLPHSGSPSHLRPYDEDGTEYNALQRKDGRRANDGQAAGRAAAQGCFRKPEGWRAQVGFMQPIREGARR